MRQRTGAGSADLLILTHGRLMPMNKAHPVPMLLAAGRGVQRDYVAAAHWFRKSAEQGFTQAQYNLGVLYANGRGVLRDDVVAYRWFSIAAAAGHPKAAGNRDLVARRLTPAQRADGDRLAREWGEKFKARKR